jgi:hypothetical protein
MLGRWLLLSYLGRLPNPKVAFLIRLEVKRGWAVAGCRSGLVLKQLKPLNYLNCLL